MSNFFGVDYTITRPAVGSRNEDTGSWEEAAATTFTSKMTVRSLTSYELANVPEGERGKEGVSIFSHGAISGGDEATGRRGDTFTWGGRTYRVKRVDNRSAGIIPHYEAVAFLEENTDD